MLNFLNVTLTQDILKTSKRIVWLHWFSDEFPIAVISKKVRIGNSYYILYCVPYILYEKKNLILVDVFINSTSITVERFGF